MKKALRLVLIVSVLILVCALPAFAYRSHGHFRGDVWIGPVWTPWWGPSAYPYYYPYPYIYDSPTVVIEREPYIEPYLYETPEVQHEVQYYWYYCKKPKGYYPYVQRCPGGWTKVNPSPQEEKE